MGQISDFLDDDDKRREAASAGAGALQAATPQPATPPAAPPARAAQPESEISRFLADAPPPERGLKGWAQDIGATAVKGLIGAAEAGMGLTDLATGGLSGRAAEGLGLRFKDWREKANDWHSEATKEAQRQYEQAEGVTGKAAAALQNPSVIATAVGESLPTMFTGGLIGRGLMLAGRMVPALAGRIGPALAGALGEGIVGAGSAAEQIRQESPNGLLSGRQAGLAGLSGATTAGFGLLGGKMAQRWGARDVDTLLAGAGRAAAKPAAQPVAKGLPRQMAQGALSEGVLEELPQSVSEQALQNIALDRPWQEDVDSAAVLGTLSGGVMGAGASGLHGLRSRPAGAEPLKPSQRMGLDANAGQLSAAAVVAVDSGASPAALAAAAQQSAQQGVQQGVQQGAQQGALQESAEAQQAALAAGQAQGPREAAALERVAALDEQLAAARQSLAALDAQAAAPDGAQDEPQQAARAQLAQQVQQLQAERESLTQGWPRMQAGKALSFGTESGAQLAGHWALAEADQLVTSHDEGLRQNPAYPQQLQPRERSRAASEAQIARMAQRLQPERLAHSADAATGAPIVGADGLVESGNARSIALKRVYAGQGPQAAAYKDFLQAHAAEFGLTPEQVAGMQKPVLVRVRDTPVNRAEFARQANAPTVAMMSPAEQARADAARMDSMDGLEPDESGDFSGAASRGFVRRFMARLPVSEQAAMVDADGRLSSAGYARVRNAVLAKAWGAGEGGSDALARMTESLDDNTRSISRALMMAAPETARMREAIAAGARHDADIAGDVAAAAQEISRLREAGQSVQQALAQTDAFGDKHTPEARALMQFMAGNARRPRRIAQLIQAYWQALDAAGDPHQQGMFGGQAAPTKQALLQAAMRQVQDAPAQGAAQEREAQEREVQEREAQEREAQDRAQAAWNALPPEGRHQLALAAGVQGVVARNAARHADWSGLPAAMQQRLAQAVKADVTQQKEGAQLETGKPAVAPTPGTYALNTSAASAPSVASAGAADGLQSRDAGHDGREGRHQKATPGAQQQFEQTAAEYGGRAAYEKARAAGRTKLDWRQWVQVRTPAFKAWFGDWQAARAKKALQAMPPVEVPRDGVLEKGVMAVARQRAREMYRQLGTAETADGRVVRFPMSGFKETAQHAADRRVLLVIPRLPVLLEQAHHLWTEPSSKANKPNVLAFHHYGVKASFGGRQAFVRLVLREDNDGHVYYDNDATSIEALDAEKAPADERQPDRKPNPGEGAEGLSGNRLAQWWQSVKPGNVSKVIDPQTGEPLVVYHGSRWAGFTQFGMGSVGATAGTGAFFTESARVASTFSGTNEAARLPPASQAQNDGYIEERRWHRGNYAVFLNIRAPAIYDFQGREWDKYPAKVPWHSSDAGSLPWHVVDEYANRLALFATQEEAEKFAHERGDAVALHNDEIVESTDSLARHARRHGNADGALFQNVVDGGRGPDGNAPGTVWVAFRGDQIKSATDNTGAFDAAHDDIRFSREQAATESLPGRRVSGTDTASGVERSGSSGPADAASVAPLTDDARAAVLQGPPVASLTGDEAPKGYPLLRAWAIRLFKAQGGYAQNPELGRVTLDERSVRDSMAHRMNPFKAAAFAAVKDVIERGVVVASAEHDGLQSFYVSAPVQIAGKDDIVTALVRRGLKDQRMYLHSVATKESLLKLINSEAASAGLALRDHGLSRSGGVSSVAPAGAPGKLPGHHVAQRLHELLTRRVGAASAAPGRDNAGHETTHESGVPRGLAARETADSRQLEGIINRNIERSGQEAAFKALAVGADQLPDALRGALAAFERATGARAVVFRNLTPHVADFNGVTVRDGTLFINETSQSPITGVAAHEWLHNLRRTHPALYHELAAEVARQGDAQGFARQWGYAPGEAQEELTAAAVGDAMTDPQFLARLAEQDGSLFARVAKSFLAFLDTLTARWRSQGSNAYLRDVQAFRDKLAAVLQAYEQQAGQAGGVGQAGLPQAMFQRVWHGTPHKGIENTGFRLDKIGTGEGLQVYGHGIYFASRREVAEFYRGMRQGQVRLDGRLMTDGHHRGAASTGDAEVDALLLDAQGDVDQAIAWARDFGQDAQAAKLERLRGRVQRGEPGQLYAAEIPEDDDLLDWDKPLDAQPAKVRRALLELAGSLPADGRAAFRQAMARRATGQDVYAFLAQRAAGADASAEGAQKGQRAASELLLEHGIPGLRYLDGDSRNAGEGSHNYVIWDEGLLTPEAAQIAPQYSRKAVRADAASQPEDLYLGHNISPEGLRHALQLGGLAAPSLAVARTSTGGLESYGSITLLANKDLIGRADMPLFDADIYSPRQPRGRYKVNASQFRTFVDGLREWPKTFARPDSEDFAEKGIEALARREVVQLQFLKEAGEPFALPQMRLSPTEKTALKQAQSKGLKTRSELLQDADFQAAAARIARQQYAKRQQSRFAGSLSDFVTDDGRAVPDIERQEAARLERHLSGDGVDVFAAREQLARKLRNKSLAQRFDNYVQALAASLSDGRVMDASPRAKPYTLDNVVDYMTRKLRGGENFNYGAGSVRAMVAAPIRSVAEAQGKRGRIISEEQWRHIKQEADARLAETLDALKPYYRFDADGWGYMDDASAAIAAGGRKLSEAFKLDDGARKLVADLRDYLKGLPTQYFEMKAQRAMPLDEFEAAVAPKGTPSDLLDALRQRGLRVLSYDPARPGARAAAIERAGRAQGSIMFSRKQATQAAYDKRIDALFAGGKAQRVGQRVLDRSDVLGLLGHADKPVLLQESKVLQGQLNHPRMTAQVWKRVPEWLENPAAVFESDTEAGRLVAIAPETLGGAPVSIIVEPQPAASGSTRMDAQLLVNAYDRSGATPFMRWIGDGLLRYVDKKKFPAVFAQSVGRRLPDTALQNKPGTPRILTEKHLAGWRKLHAGQAQPGDEAAHFSRRAPEPLEPRPDEAARLKESALEQLDRVFSHPGTVSWWHKTVGTMRNLAERQPLFKPVYEAAQQFIDDVSHFANDAADFAPRLLPRLESWRDLGKRAVSAADSQAVAAPLFEGTLSYTRGKDGSLVKTDNVDAAGVVFTDAELKGRFGLTPAQIELYRQARAAIDRSIDTTARADILRLAGRDFAHLRQAVMDAPDLRAAAVQVVEAMQEVMQGDAKRREAMRGAIEAAQERVQTAQALMQRGYAPLTRFGRYTLDVVDAQGQRQYFGLYESRREANVAAIHLRSQYPGAQVTQGTLSDDAYKLFAGITPESLELFGDLLAAPGQGKDKGQDKAFQAWLQLARNNRSAIKRLIHRKGVAGYSQDAGRVLASFIYANARQTAGALNAGRMDRAIAAIPKEQGQLRDVAMALRDYTQNPREEGQAIRGMLFAQYLGGSLASAAVNMTQPFAVTLPWLSQFGGMRQAAAQMTRALADMTRPGHRYEADLARDMAKAEEDGVVSPQEIHQLMAQARGAGALRSGDGTRRGDALAVAANAWERLKVAWGQPFALAEQFNRRCTYIAAWRLARQQGMADADAFARRAVLETQFVYTKANKPRWGRGAVGGALFTFKTYSVSYLELMHRMWTQGGTPGKQGVAWMLAMLLLMGGAGGLPFMEDAEDLVDGLAQLAGYNTSVKQWRRQALQDIVGDGLAEFIESGVSGLPGAPIDISGRLGMGNLLPGTGLLLTKQNRERDLLDVAGPAGDLLARGFTAGRKLLTGDVGGAAMELAPTAARNLAKGADMLATGSYRDAKGYKVLDTTALEALAKAAGFQPRSVAQVQEGNAFMMRSKSFYQHTSAEIKAQWARALFEKDEAALQRVRQRVADWNRHNPEQPITVRMPDIWRRVREMGKERSQRIADSAPRALRQQMRQALAQEG